MQSARPEGAGCRPPEADHALYPAAAEISHLVYPQFPAFPKLAPH